MNLLRIVTIAVLDTSLTRYTGCTLRLGRIYTTHSSQYAFSLLFWWHIVVCDPITPRPGALIDIHLSHTSTSQHPPLTPQVRFTRVLTLFS